MEGIVEEKLLHPQVDWNLCDSRDEMNLAEFPLSCMANRAPRGVKTLVFEDEVWDHGKNEMVARKLTIAGSDDYGLPTALDEDVLVFLMKLTKQANGFTEPKVHFSRYQVIQLLGWDEGGKSYKRLDESLHRWSGVTLRYKRAWWDKRGQRWKDQSFHVLESVELCGREGGDQLTLPLSSFTWNGVLFNSFQSGYMKRLDLEIYKQLRLSGSRRAYRFLDKRFYHKPRWEFSLREFACDHIGLSRSYDNANIKRKLRGIIDELVEIGFVEARSEEETFQKIGHGDWRVVFEKKAAMAPGVEQSEEELKVSGLERELESRGVSGKVAAELNAQFSEERILEKVELHDWLLSRKDKRIGENPAGYLVKAIKEDFVLPKGFQTKAMRKEKERVAAEKKAQVSAQKEQEDSRRRKAIEERERPLRAYLNSLSPLEQTSLEEEAVAATDGFRRKRYEDTKKKGGPTFEDYRELILFDFIERVVLKLVPNEQ